MTVVRSTLMLRLMTIDNDLFQGTEQQVAAEQSWHANEHALKQLQFARTNHIHFVAECAAFNGLDFCRSVLAVFTHLNSYLRVCSRMNLATADSLCSPLNRETSLPLFNTITVGTPNTPNRKLDAGWAKQSILYMTTDGYARDIVSIMLVIELLNGQSGAYTCLWVSTEVTDIALHLPIVLLCL